MAGSGGPCGAEYRLTWGSLRGGTSLSERAGLGAMRDPSFSISHEGSFLFYLP